MKSFPSKFKPENKELFSQYNYDRNICYLRKDIYESLIKGEDWFDLVSFDNSYVKDIDTTRKMADQLAKELRDLGWTVNYIFAETALGFGEKYSNQQDI